MDAFDTLSVAAVVNENYLCMHGGISPYLYKLEDINKKVDRFCEPPLEGILCDLLWADPAKDDNANKQVPSFHFASALWLLF